MFYDIVLHIKGKKSGVVWKGEVLMKRYKTMIILFCIAIILAVFLVTTNRSEQRYFFIDQVQFPLIELQGIIKMQEDDGWDKPQLISNKTITIIDSLWYGTASYSFPNKALSAKDHDLLSGINSALQKLPMNDNYQIAKWAEQDIKRAKILNEALKDAGLAMETSYNKEWNFFIEQCEILSEKLIEYGYYEF